MIKAAKLGHQLFAKPPQWLAKQCQRNFNRALLDILRRDPEQTDRQAAEALMEWFEPEPLIIRGPLLTTLSWTSERVIERTQGIVADVYMHEAQVPFAGTPELWRLIGSNSYRFTTRVSFTTKIARLRAFQADRDVEHFRAAMVDDLDKARLHATEQGPAIDAFRACLHTAVEHCFGHQDIAGVRDRARELKAGDDRLNAALSRTGS